VLSRRVFSSLPEKRGERFFLANQTITETGDLTISIDRDDMESGVLMRLNGRLSIDTSPAFRERLLAVLQREPAEAVIVDLSEAHYIDLSGIATLIEALKIAGNRKTTLHLKGMHGPFLRLLEVTGLMPLFEGTGRAGAQPEPGGN
jgi:anti-anti-sigma factor